MLMATKAEVLASIKDGSIFATAEVGLMKRKKEEAINRMLDRLDQKIMFVGPIKPIESSGINHKDGAAGDYGPNGIHYQGD